MPPKIKPPKRRKTSPRPSTSFNPNVTMRQSVQLIDLPLEVIEDIVENLDCVDIVSLRSSCTYMKSILHTEGQTGRRIWNKVRKREGWPDPSVIGISDFQFLESKHGRGCNFCEDAPRVRTPRWEFGGIRMCEECKPVYTTRHYELDDVTLARCQYLPHMEVDGWTPGSGWRGHLQSWSYRVYLTKSIPDHDLTEIEEGELRRKLDAMQIFINQVKKIDVRMDVAHRKTLEKLVAKRAAAVKEFMKSKFPYLHARMYNSFDSYRNAIGKSTTFSKRSQTMFVRSVTKELEKDASKFHRIHSDLHLQDICEKEGLWLYFTSEQTEIIQKDFLTYMEVESMMQPAIQEQLKARRRIEWSEKYMSGRNMNNYDKAELHASTPYNAGRPEDECGFAMLSQTVYERINRRTEWVQKFLGNSPRTRWTILDEQELFETDVFKTAVPEEEHVFADLAKPICERAIRRTEWWKKYVETNPATTMLHPELIEIDAFRTACEDQEQQFAEQVKKCIMAAEKWMTGMTEETIELSKHKRILWCQRCRYCATVGATFELITQHRLQCKGQIGVFRTS